MAYRLGADGGTREPRGMHPLAARPLKSGCRPCGRALNGTDVAGGLLTASAAAVGVSSSRRRIMASRVDMRCGSTYVNERRSKLWLDEYGRDNAKICRVLKDS